MRIVSNAIIANVVAVELNVVAAVRNTACQDTGASGSDLSSRLFMGPSAGKKPVKPHASKHAVHSPALPTTSGERLSLRENRTYRMFAACQQGRLRRGWQLSKLPATFALSIAG